MDTLSQINRKHTPQTMQADPRQSRNSAGGYAFEVTPEQRLRRFLVLGVEGGTYYASAKDLAVQNATVVEEMARTNPSLLVDTIVDVSVRGAAPKVQPALFALAYAIGIPESRPAALAALPEVVRTGSHMLTLHRYLKGLSGRGTAVRRAIAGWYTDPPTDDVAFQAVKYQSRDGWSQRDVLRLAKPKTLETDRGALFGWITRGEVSPLSPPVIIGHRMAHDAASAAEVAVAVRQYRLSWEMVPSEHLNAPVVWGALLDVGVPLGALIRQLPRLTRIGVIGLGAGNRTAEIVSRLGDHAALRKARIHPLNVLVALRTYQSGRSEKGDSTWTPDTRVVDALDAAFYASFEAVEPAGKRTMVALDLSASMTWSNVAGMSITPREASAALAMVTLATEPDSMVVGFTGGYTGGSWGRAYTYGITPLTVSPRQRLDDVTRYIDTLAAGGTDCALPILYAQANGILVDTFVIYTDNESWAGPVHVHQALRDYRMATGIEARLVVVGMTATQWSVTDPSDPLSLDVAGFDTATPSLISGFSRGDF